jgi:hypothetical protein
MVAHTCNPSYLGGGDRSIKFEDSLGEKAWDTNWKIKGRRVGSSGRALS